MGFLDELKSAAGEIVDIVKEKAEAAEQETDIAEQEDLEGPSVMIQAALTKGVKLYLSVSETTMGGYLHFIAKADRLLTPESITVPEDVVGVVETLGGGQTVAGDLVRVAVNSLETLPTAREQLDAIKQEERELADLLGDDVDSDNDQDAVDEEPESLELEQLVSLVELIKNGREEEAEKRAGKLLEGNEEFNNPVVARFMIKRLTPSGPSDNLTLWYEKALYYSPLDNDLLEIVSQQRQDGPGSLLSQIQALSR